MFRSDSTPSVQIWFRPPDSVRDSLRNNKLGVCGAGLVVCGLASVVNAAMAVRHKATKEFYLHDYVNTHWITSIYFLAGLSTVCLHKLKLNYFLFTSICLDSVAVMVAAGAFVFDCANIDYLRIIDNPYYRLYFFDRKTALVTYAAIDMLNCLAAAAFSIAALDEMRIMSKRYFSPVNDFKSRPLLYCSIVQCIVGQSKLTLWVVEVAWSRSLGVVKQFVFFNYTMDEPVWNLIYTLTGIFGILVASNGSRTLCYCSLALTSLSLFPVIQYLWIDYRWLLSVRTSDIVAKIPKPHPVLHINIALSVFHLVIIYVVVIILMRRLVRNALPWNTSKISIESTLKQTIMCSGIYLISAGVVLLFIDVAHVAGGTFFRLFIPTEQRLPFLLVPAGVLCLLMLRRNEFVPMAIACQLPLLVMCLQSSFFHVASFVYLSDNAYFAENLCRLFFFGKLGCRSRVEKLGVYAHFFEALITLLLMIVCSFLLVAFVRLCRLFALVLQYPMSDEEKRKLRRRNLLLYFLGVGQLALGVAVVIVSILLPAHDQLRDNPHPFVHIHTFIYRISLSLPFLLYPCTQLVLFSKMHVKPMCALSCVFISFVWTTDIFLQLDYRLLDSLGFGWKLTTAMEIVTLMLQFGIGAQCVLLLDLGQNRLPQFDFTDYAGAATRMQSSGLEFNDEESMNTDESYCEPVDLDHDHAIVNKM